MATPEQIAINRQITVAKSADEVYLIVSRVGLGALNLVNCVTALQRIAKAMPSLTIGSRNSRKDLSSLEDLMEITAKQLKTANCESRHGPRPHLN